MAQLLDIDFFRDFKLETPISGMVCKITSPKGIRSNENTGFVYRFHSELIYMYNGKATSLDAGLYHVTLTCKPEDRLIWNHYIFRVDSDGKAYPIAEYLDQYNSEWVRDALPIVKKAFAGEATDPIKLTRYEHKAPKTSGWGKLTK